MKRILIEVRKIHKKIITRNSFFGISDSHRYISEKGEISLIHPCIATMESYEIYCIRGNLLDDIERFETLEAAEKEIERLLL
jgi:hypothetical protein